MSKKKLAFLGVLGAVFLGIGLYLRFFDPQKNHVAYEIFGVGTWIAGVASYLLYPRLKEIALFLLGLLVLHVGVILLLKEQPPSPKVLGSMVFIFGIGVVLNSGFSDYMHSRKKRKEEIDRPPSP